MTVLNPPIAIKALATHDADDLRGALMAGMLGIPSTGLTVRQGVVPSWGLELAVAQRAAGANMSVDVAAGIALVQAPTSGHGGWYVLNDNPLNLVIAAAHATLARTDLVIARVSDTQYHAGGDNAAAVKVITGVAGAGVPAVPVADGAYVALGQVAIAAAATSIVNANITLNTSATRPYAIGLGGVLPVANTAARTALSAYDGMVCYQLDTDRLYVFRSSAWEAVGLGAASDVGPTAWTGADIYYSGTIANTTKNGAYRIHNGWLDGWSWSDQNDNGPTFGGSSTSLQVVMPPVAPSNITDTDTSRDRVNLGTFAWIHDTGAPFASGIVFRDDATGRGRCAVAGGDFTQGSSFRKCLQVSWHYPVAL